MVKRKSRQNSKSGVIFDLSESSDATYVKQDKAVCPHVNKSVDTNTLRKNFRGNGQLSNRDCSDCKRLNCPTYEDIRLCLRCGNCCCGPEKSNHGLSHFEKSHSDSHSLSLKLENLCVWCYECKVEISADSSQKLRSCVDYVRQQRDKQVLSGIKKTLSNESGLTDPLANNSAETNDFAKDNVACNTNKNRLLSDSSKTHVKGLTNLGNTCFFNSVLQCLAQTPELTDVLKLLLVVGQTFELPLDDDDEVLGGELKKVGPVSESLLELLTDMKKPDGSNVLTPRKLLENLRRKCPQFEGGDQHDAHELLRQLLDVVHTEDLKRYQLLILQKLGLSTKVNPSEVAQDKKDKIKELYRKVSENVVVVPDQIFKGILVSQLQCQSCYHTSDCVENFLDLSLPVTAEKSMPPGTRRKNQVISKNEEVEDNEKQGQAQPSTYEIRRKRKVVRSGRNRRNGQHTEDGQGEPSITEEDKKESSDADVEDNDVFTDDRKIDVNESGYSSEKLASSRTSPTAETRDAEDSACASPSTVPCVSWITDAIAGLQLEEPNTQHTCEKNAPHRPESGLGSSIVSVQESNVSNVLEPSDVTQSVDSSDSLKCNPSCTSDARTLGDYLSNESIQDVGLYSQVSSEQDDIQTVSKHDDPLDEIYCVNSPVRDKNVSTVLIVDNNDDDIDGNFDKTYTAVGDSADVDKELSNFNQNDNDITGYDCSQQLARSSPIDVTHGESLDSKLLSMSLQSYNAEFTSPSPNQGDDFSDSLVAPTVPKDSLTETTENVDIIPKPVENNSEMGFVLVGGVVNNDNHDLATSISKEKTELATSKRKGTAYDTSLCNGGRKQTISATRNKSDDEDGLDEVNLYNNGHITLAPRYHCSEGECSVLSCLNHFTAIEMMAGSNMVGCEACTRQNKGSKDKEPKTVYRVSSKRLLIHSPPPVLILHLKRFQVQAQRYSVKKLGCHVTFPDILDIAPFCSHSVQKKLRPGQTKILYSLYGVVAHSGSLHGGHYYSYVKVRYGESEEGKPRQGTWYTISDSFTREVTADTVFNSQAYLLFYERFF